MGPEGVQRRRDRSSYLAVTDRQVVGISLFLSCHTRARLRHLNVGWACQRLPKRLYILDDVVTFATEDGEFIGETRINPDRDYQPKGEGFQR